ncbi:MAG: chaperonin GroEL [Planctomycetota bacterium]|nr:MAG: chaperonin GroEL [Planctomycetota bacterium]
MLRAAKALDGLKLDGDERFGVTLVKNVLEMPLRMIAENAGLDGAVVANRVRKSNDPNYGYDALNEKYGDMFEFGVVDPVKVVRCALQNAASVANLLLTTECIIVNEPKKEDKDAHHDHHDDMGGGGMGGMGGMGMGGMGGMPGMM